MGFIEDLQNVKTETENKNENVVMEILKHFRTQINSTKFEDRLKKRLTDSIKDNKRETRLEIEFWDYHDGCSATNFYASCCDTWELAYGEHYYNGVRLTDVSKEVVNHHLLPMFIDKLRELGLTYRIEEYGGRLGYPHWIVYVDLTKI